MTRLEKLARQVVNELGGASWYPCYTTIDKPNPQPRSVELLRRYFRIKDSAALASPPLPSGRAPDAMSPKAGIGRTNSRGAT